MSYENPTEIERDLHAAVIRLCTELSSVRCLVTGLCQHIRTTQGQESLDAVLAVAQKEAAACEQVNALEADKYLVRRFSSGLAKS